MSAQTAIAPSVEPPWWTQPPAPGLYPGVTYEVYARWSAINNSTLRKFDRSPLHARYAMLHPDEDTTDAKEFGHAVHIAILEPDRFETEFRVMPQMGDRRSSKVREAEQAFLKANPELTFLEEEEHRRCLVMRDAVWSHPAAKEFLRAQGKNEVSAVWKDPETGVPCKGRQDRFAMWDRWPTVGDLKSTIDASPRAFSRSIEKFGYADQGAMYLDGFNAVAPFKGGERRYVLVAVEKDPPHGVAVYELDPLSIAIGRKRYRRHLTEYAACLESGKWPGYCEGMDLLSLPPWAVKGEEE